MPCQKYSRRFFRKCFRFSQATFFALEKLHFLCTRQESNLHQRRRRPTFYPLDYGCICYKFVTSSCISYHMQTKLSSNQKNKKKFPKKLQKIPYSPLLILSIRLSLWIRFLIKNVIPSCPITNAAASKNVSRAG